MLFYVYIGSTVFVWFNEFKSLHDMNKRLKKEGYTFNSRRFGGIGDIIVGGLFLVALSIPLFNLIFPLAGLNKERTYDEYKNMMLEAGHIDEPEFIDNKIVKDSIQVNDTKLVERVNRSNHIYYSPMYKEEDTIDEKGHVYKKEFFRNRH